MSVSQRLAALRRLAADPAATPGERDSARRRIEEHEAKYCGGSVSSHTRETHSFSGDDDFLKWVMNHVAQSFVDEHENYRREVRTTGSSVHAPRYHNSPAGHAFCWEFSRWAAVNPRGPFGLVDRVASWHDPMSRTTKFTWPCPSCGGDTSVAIADDVMTYSSFEPGAKEWIIKQLFPFWNGNSDNRCEKCREPQRAAVRRGSDEVDR